MTEHDPTRTALIEAVFDVYYELFPDGLPEDRRSAYHALVNFTMQSQDTPSAATVSEVRTACAKRIDAAAEEERMNPIDEHTDDGTIDKLYIADLETEIARLRRDLEISRQASAAETKRADEAERARDDYRAALEDVRGRLEFRKSENDTLRADLADAAERAERAEAEVARLREALQWIADTPATTQQLPFIIEHARRALDPDETDE